MDKDALKKFYFSGASNYKSFQGSKAKPVATGSTLHDDEDATNVSASNVNVSLPSTIADHEGSPKNTLATAGGGGGGGSAYNAVRNIAAKKAAVDTSKNTTTATGSKSQTPDAVSKQYFAFLTQQQSLQKEHNHLEEVIGSLESSRRDRQSQLTKGRRQALELLHEIEAAADWNLKSKYDVQQLIRDCTLSLQPVELVSGEEPQFMAVKQIGQRLSKIKQSKGSSLQFAPHQLVVDQAMRRLSLLETTLSEGNMDSTNLARIVDTMLIQLETVCELPTVESLVEECEKIVDKASFKIEDARAKRDEAVADGEVHIAERLCYEVIEEHEEMLRHVVDKAKVLELAIEQNSVTDNVRDQYHTKTFGEFDRIRVRSKKLKDRCEEDMKRVFALREKVEEVEGQTAEKVISDRQRSDALLVENGQKLDTVFAKMEELEREVETLERERHREIQKRLVEKDKDEHRRAEFAKFCSIADEHTIPLERTIKNMDVMIHAADVVQDLLNNGFDSLKTDLNERHKLLKTVKIESHKQHVEVFRGLLLELAEIVYRKERMVEETDKKIQQAHVQQELLAETFNPNAKKFGDMKKSLLQNRDELEEDVQELKQRAASSIDQFKFSEEALNAAEVDFVHPVTEQQHHTVAMRAKMLEFKAMTVGHTDGQPIMQEIEGLKRDVNETRALLDTANVSTTGTTAKALPMIRAANRSRLKQ